MTTSEKALLSSAVIAVLGSEIFLAHQVSELREQVQMLQTNQSAVTMQLGTLEQGRKEIRRELSALREKKQSSEPATNHPSTAGTTFANADMAQPSPTLEQDIDSAYAQPTAGKREAALEYLSKNIAPVDIPRALA